MLYCTVLTIALLLHSSEYVVTCSVDITIDITVSVYTPVDEMVVLHATLRTVHCVQCIGNGV